MLKRAKYRRRGIGSRAVQATPSRDMVLGALHRLSGVRCRSVPDMRGGRSPMRGASPLIPRSAGDASRPHHRGATPIFGFDLTVLCGEIGSGGSSHVNLPDGF